MTEILLRLIGFGDPPLALLDTEVEYYLKPNSTFYRFGNRISSNEFGMRADSLVTAVQNKHKKLFIFGDSIVYGNHFLDQSEIIAFQLEELVRHKGIKAFSVAASSWGPQNILEYVKKFGPFKGKYAVVVQSSHDRRDIPFKSRNIVPYRLEKSYTAISDFFFAIHNRMFSSRGQEIKPETKILDPDLALKILLQILIKDFEKVVLVHHSTTHELGMSKNKNVDFYKALSDELDIEFVATTTLYEQQCQAVDIYRDHIHLNAKGTFCLAKIISEKMYE